MTLEQIRMAVLNSRSDTLVAQRFREAFGIRGYQERNARTITRRDMDARIARREVMSLMAQRYGALDRGTS